MCEVCDNIYEYRLDCQGIRYDEYDDIFLSDCADSYYDFAVDYCYRCGKKLDKSMVKPGRDPEQVAAEEKWRKENPEEAERWAKINSAIAAQFEEAQEFGQKFLDGDEETRKKFFEGMNKRIQSIKGDRDDGKKK